MNNIRSQAICILIIAALGGDVCFADFTITYQLQEPTEFTQPQTTLLRDAMEQSVQLWEGIILGHQASDADIVFPIDVVATSSGLAAANAQGVTSSGGFSVPSSGTIWINADQIAPATDGLGIAPGVNILDELLAHEIAHALGFGGLWVANGVYESDSGRYTGQFGLAAYQAEFDSAATAVPVELAGTRASAGFHWDQLFRSSVQEGNPGDPMSLSPLTGIVDGQGRDLGLELMTAALDPDFGEPFLSDTTIQSLRDIGYAVVPAPTGTLLFIVGVVLMAIRSRPLNSGAKRQRIL